MRTHPSQTTAIARSAGKVGIAVFSSRILGLVREQVFAAFFGAGFAFDAYVVAFRIPNLLRDLFAEGALSSSFVAVFTDYRTNRGQQETWRLAHMVFTASLLIVGALSLIGMFASGFLVRFMSPDFAKVPGKIELATLMTTIMFPFLLLVSQSAIAMGMLNSLGRFFMPAMASSFFNLGSIVCGVLFSYCMPWFGLHPIVGMAFGVLAGGFLQMWVQMPSLRQEGYRYKPALDFKDPGLVRVGTLMLPAVIGLAAPQINIFINTFFAASCVEGSVSWLNYAFRIMMFPIGLVGVSLSIATMPVVSRYAAQDDIQGLRQAYVSSTILSFVFSLPAMVGLIVLAEPIIHVIYQHGRFTAADTAQTAGALALYAVGLFAYAAQKIVVPVFYALNKPRYPVIASFLSVAINISCVLAFLGHYQHRAIALSTSLCMIANFLYLSFMLYRLVQGYDIRRIGKSLVRILTVSLCMGIVAYSVNRLCAGLAGSGTVGAAVGLFAAIGVAGLFYGAAISVAGIQELAPLRHKLAGMLAGKSR
jgi:putative peptidoglycan lipid II flippase